ncbi:hypothetical protein ACHAXS_005012 [Conticribra weissflogii]
MVWDLAHDVAEKFFFSSNVTVTLYPSPDLSEEPKVEWTATTPIAVACGVSVLAMRNDTISNNEFDDRGEFFWHHVFSQAMDPSVPSLDHVVSVSLNDDSLKRFVDVSSMQSIFDSNQNGLDGVVNGGGTTAADGSKENLVFRLFAFLPFGRGVLVSRIYSVEVDVGLMSDPQGVVNRAIKLTVGEFNATTGSGSPKFPSGESSLAFSHGLCNDDGVIANSSSSINEMKNLNCNVDSELSVVVKATDSMIEFEISGIEKKQGGGVAAAFQYGIDANKISLDDLSIEAFEDSDGINDNGEGSSHGLVRAQDVSLIPNAFISFISTTLTAEDVEQSDLVVGGVWIDDQMFVYHSTQHRFALKNYVNPTQATSDTASVSQTHHNSTLCPSSPIANLALLSKGASVLSVSSNFGTSPSDVTSTYGGNKAIDEDPSTAWSSDGDGDDAFITILLPYPSNVVYVDFHTRTMVTSAQVSEYEVEVDGGFVIASGCEVLDSSQPFDCEVIGYDGEVGARNVTEVTFQVVGSSGGNTGAVSVGVYGCAADDELDSLPSSSEGDDVTDIAVLSETDAGIGGNSIADESKVSSNAGEGNKDGAREGESDTNGSTADAESAGFEIQVPTICRFSSLLVMSFFIAVDL